MVEVDTNIEEQANACVVKSRYALTVLDIFIDRCGLKVLKGALGGREFIVDDPSSYDEPYLFDPAGQLAAVRAEVQELQRGINALSALISGKPLPHGPPRRRGFNDDD